MSGDIPYKTARASILERVRRKGEIQYEKVPNGQFGTITVSGRMCIYSEFVKDSVLCFREGSEFHSFERNLVHGGHYG